MARYTERNRRWLIPRQSIERGTEFGIAFEPLPCPAGAVELEKGRVAFGIAPIGAWTYAGRKELLAHAIMCSREAVRTCRQHALLSAARRQVRQPRGGNDGRAKADQAVANSLA
jgi:hypothetical protein